MDISLVSLHDASGPLPITWATVGLVLAIIFLSILLRIVLPSPEPLVKD